MINPRNCGIKNHCPVWALTISVRFSEPLIITTPINDNPMNTSYAIICEAPLRLPNRAYLLLDDHPARTTLYTPNEDIPKKNNIPIFGLITTQSGATGIKAKFNNTVIITTIGAMIKTGLSANGGIQSSLKNIFIMSARTCIRPKGPTLFGPYRSCHTASPLRSTHIRNAASVKAPNKIVTITRSE